MGCRREGDVFPFFALAEERERESLVREERGEERLTRGGSEMRCFFLGVAKMTRGFESFNVRRRGA